MGWLIWGILLPFCLLAAGSVAHRTYRDHAGPRLVDRAQREFRLRREWLEVRFLDHLGRIDPIERSRWDDARWCDDVLWARDRRTGRLLALVAVEFEADPLIDHPDHPPRHATVLFEYARGRWHGDGRHLEEIRPHEAFLRHQQIEPIEAPGLRKV